MASQELTRAIAAQRALLEQFGTAQTPEEFRRIYKKFCLDHSGPLPEGTTIERVDANGVPGEWVIPANATDGRTLLYLHGGGYLVGGSEEVREMVARIAQAARARALVIDYRLAPEHPHPAAVEDAVTAYRWLIAQGTRPERLTVAGESAGGGLTLALLVSLRDAGDPLPAAAVPISPWVDLEAIGESMVKNAEVDPLVNKDVLFGMRDAYLQGQDPRTPSAAPLYADLRGLPPLLIVVGGSETLLDDASRLADRARQAGVDVTYEPSDQMIHIWQAFGEFLYEARESTDRIGRFIKERTS